MQTLTASIIVLGVVVRKGTPRSRHLSEPGFEFVYMNQDGSVRELSPAERAYLSQEFSGADSGRPYVKSGCEGRDGWGSLSGFIERRQVPAQIEILPVHPDFDARAQELGFDILDAHRAAGDIIETRPDGSVSCTRNPRISHAERYELMRNWELAYQRKRERLAMMHLPGDEPDD